MISRRSFMFGLGATVPLGLSGYSIGVEPRLAPRVVSYQVSPTGWSFDRTLRIGVIADLHACQPWMTAERIEAIVASANELRPDMFVLLGDFVEGIHGFLASPLPMDQWGGPLGDLEAPLGTYAVLGNHDWWGGDAHAVRATLERRHIPVMENEHELVTLSGGDSFWLAGLGDQLAFRRTKTGVDDLPGLTARVPDDGRPAVLLAHEPDIFPEVSARFGLTLAGHTHGGQIKLPVLGRAPVASDYGQRYAYGHIAEDTRQMVISGGLGVSGFPVRLGVPPEINLVEIGPAA